MSEKEPDRLITIERKLIDFRESCDNVETGGELDYEIERWHSYVGDGSVAWLVKELKSQREISIGWHEKYHKALETAYEEQKEAAYLKRALRMINETMDEGGVYSTLFIGDINITLPEFIEAALAGEPLPEESK